MRGQLSVTHTAGSQETLYWGIDLTGLGLGLGLCHYKEILTLAGGFSHSEPKQEMQSDNEHSQGTKHFVLEPVGWPQEGDFALASAAYLEGY